MKLNHYQIFNKIKHWIAPICFALFPVISVYTHNIELVAPSRLFVPILYALLLMLISSTVFLTIFKSISKANLYTSIWLILFFSYGYIYLKLGESAWMKLLPLSVNKVLLITYVLVLGTIAIGLKRWKSNNSTLSSMLAIVGLVLVGFNIVKIIPFEIQRVISQDRLTTQISTNLRIKPISTNELVKPDIYHIIFDRYGRNDILENLGFDNSPHEEYLIKQGFYIAENSYANYPSTFLSLSSSLNLTYLDFLTETMGENAKDRIPVFRKMIEENSLTYFLKDQGYYYSIAGSFWDPTKYAGMADENINLFSAFDEFQLYIYERTLLNTVRGLIENNQVYTGSLRHDLMQLNLDYRLKFLLQPNDTNQPRFVFSHFLMPHEPNIFSSDCLPLNFDQMAKRESMKGYFDETECANFVMKQIVERVKRDATRPVVIIFQSDEGPYLPEEIYNIDNQLVPPTRVAYKNHAAIFNAIYMTQINNPQDQVDYKSIGFTSDSSPVNTFRLVLNYYFGTNLPILENHTYYYENESQPYVFTNVDSYLK